MCECGCVMNHRRFSFPGPGKAFYILTLLGACENCSAPTAVWIELIEPGHALWDDYKRGDFLDGPLLFDQWPDNKGISITTGLLSSEFVKALSSHLIGVNSTELGENGLIDAAGAEVILEEMYADAQVQPYLPPEGDQ